MDSAGNLLITANLLYTRANSTSSHNPEDQTRPPIYKAVGIILAIASGIFIGVSFVLKKVGLMKANEKYDEAAGEGYGYLKNAFWWLGMTLMIMGEVCNFVAYAFVDAILVTPLGALSVVITTILSAIFLKERLSMVGKVGCFLCIVGSVVIVMNAPSESSAANIQEMQHFVIAPGFLTYAGVIVVGCTYIALWVAPRYGKKSMMVYLSICSLIGGLSVVATQGLGAAIVAQIGGTPQFNQWFLYVLFIFVISTLITEIIYLNKALNLFNAALVTPTYYVFFTSSTIVTSAILFRGFKGSVTSIITVVMGFFVICAGVVLLQLSKSAKDVPDTAVFAGDLDQVRTIAEQEQPETEPKADAIRGTAAIVRRISSARRKWELEEARRLYEEKQQDLEPIGEGEHVHVQWDGLRRRKTTLRVSRSTDSRSRSQSFPNFASPSSPTQHPPLGMSYFPDDSESDNDENPTENTEAKVSFFDNIKSKHISPFGMRPRDKNQTRVQSRAPLIPLTSISIPETQGAKDNPYSASDTASKDHVFGLPPTLKTKFESKSEKLALNQPRSGSVASSIQSEPTMPLHSARREFSFQNIFSRAQAASILPTNEIDNVSPPVVSGGQIEREDSTRIVTVASEEAVLGLVKHGEEVKGDLVINVVDEPHAKFQHLDDSKNTRPPEEEATFSRTASESEIYDIQRKKWDASKVRGAKGVVVPSAATPKKDEVP